MSISTYSELQTAVQNWLVRTDSDIVSRTPEFISLFESRFKRKTRHWRMEKRATLSLTASDGYVVLPADYLEMRSLHLNTDPKRQLEYRTPQQIRDLWLGSETSRPEVYSVVGGEVLFGPTPDSDYEAEMDYYAFSVLSDSNTTNWLLTHHPDIYLFGALVMAEPYIGADERIVLWKGQLDEALEELRVEGRKAQWAGVLTMTSDVAKV